ncbi:MAG TPA: methyl-accepting chemotaxis protein [Chloroflexota bacterium]|nr:methyl-accepting chemotaxis protein [Chloroflexota bacterium]
MTSGISAKLWAGFGAVLVLLAIVGGIGWHNTVTSSAAFANLYDDELTQLEDLSTALRLLYELRLGAMSVVYASSDASQRATLIAADNQRLALIDETMRRIASYDVSSQERQAMRTWDQAYPAFLASRRQVITLVDQSRMDSATLLRNGDASDTLGPAVDALKGLIGLQIDSAAAKRADVTGASDLAAHGILVVSALALVVVVAVAYLLSRHIARGVSQVARAAVGLARGDLNQTLDVRSGDEIGQMADAFRDMVSRLRTVTTDIQAGASGLSVASNEILAAVAQQSSGASEQSAAIAQTAATVAQVKASAEQAVQMAMVVSDTAQEASRVAGDGVQAAQHAADGMTDLRDKVESIAENILALSEQSQKIGEIITTVSDLADQSNLLALNAAIEASRAGEQGKGFAVVATEIRNLAEQSKAATAQVRTILGDIQRATNATVLSTEQGTRGVDDGIRLVEKTGQTIGELAHVIDQASQSAHLIAASVRQHSVGMEQVAAAMVNINQATTHNLAATADTRKAAEHLTTLAGGLTRTVAQYKV